MSVRPKNLLKHSNFDPVTLLSRYLHFPCCPTRSSTNEAKKDQKRPKGTERLRITSAMPHLAKIQQNSLQILYYRWPNQNRIKTHWDPSLQIGPLTPPLCQDQKGPNASGPPPRCHPERKFNRTASKYFTVGGRITNGSKLTEIHHFKFSPLYPPIQLRLRQFPYA